jgi:ArsR family transcriptional regulator, virulence genes transcriptional regulator
MPLQEASPMRAFTAKAAEASAMLRELANENRLLILCTLIDRKHATVGELAEAVGLAQSAVSQHLARMRDQNIVTCERHGTSMYYSVTNKDIGRVLQTLKSIYC